MSAACVIPRGRGMRQIGMSRLPANRPPSKKGAGL